MSQIVKSSNGGVLPAEETKRLWQLSPIQKVFLDAHPRDYNHYNQSFLLQTKSRIPGDRILASAKAVAQRHEMLRARYQRDSEGEWWQYISDDDIAHSCFEHHNVNSVYEMQALVQQRQRSFTIELGSLFAVDVFDAPDVEQVVLFSAHHLVTDLVSWCTIWHEMEEWLRGSPISTSTDSFKQWCIAQQRNSQVPLLSDLLPFTPRPANFAYWGLAANQNETENYEQFKETLGADATSRLLAAAQGLLDCDVSDMLVAAIDSSFLTVFNDREAPAIYLEGHGREGVNWPKKHDMSATVGWFTTLHPRQLLHDPSRSFRDSVALAKQVREQIPENGRRYFASKCHNSNLSMVNEDIEILLNYAGRFQQLEGEASLFTKPTGPIEEIIVSQWSPNTQHLGLIEVTVAISEGRMVIKVDVNKRMKHQEKLVQWFKLFRESLVKF